MPIFLFFFFASLFFFCCCFVIWRLQVKLDVGPRCVFLDALQQTAVLFFCVELEDLELVFIFLFFCST